METFIRSKINLRIYAEYGWIGWVQVLQELSVDEFRVYKLKVYHTIQKSSKFGTYPVGHEFWYRNYQGDPQLNLGYFDTDLEKEYHKVMGFLSSQALKN